VLLRLGAGLTLAVHLPAADSDRALRVQRERHAELADPDLHDEVVLDRLPRRERPPGALALGRAALGATAVALVLGTLTSLAVSRFDFFGREADLAVVILPIALPGIITGLALQDDLHDGRASTFGLLTIIIGHATFCIVVVYNNALARLRRRRVARARRRSTSAPTAGRRSASSRSRRCARRCSPAGCSRSRSPSTRSS
jgi:hypothetical protein